jgi:D-threonate/D-erythronate kinase
MVECVLIADDLTGACDAAAPFAAAGLRTLVPLDGVARDGDVLAFSTESRDVEPDEARRRLCDVAAVVRRMAPRIVFKKIDSTLRGNSGHEIVTALDAFDCAAAVVTPAFPAMGRIVEGGELRVTQDSAFAPIDVREYLAAHGAACAHATVGAIADAVAVGARFVTADALCSADLDELAAEILALHARILWAGSAGLAGALASRLARHAPRRVEPSRGPVLFCIGSDHPVTVEQQRRLGDHPGLRPIARDAAPETVRALLAGFRPAAICLSGGDTAALVCRALDVRAIELHREFAPGIPLGILHGGPFDGVAVITKSGGFGAADTLVHIAEVFHA